MSGAPTKIAKMTPYIGTHDMTFHCDDVTACTMLKSLDRFKNHEIVRTRDPELLEKAEIVVDVGDVFDPDRLRLDHHQRSFQSTIKDFHPDVETTRPDQPPRLSSAGLVWMFFGKDYIAQKLNLGTNLDDEKQKMVKAIFAKAYTEFIEEIDAIDNGVEIASGDNLVYNYHINSGISSRVGRFNPITEDASPEERLEQFKKAMAMVDAEMSEGIKFLGDVWWPKRQEFRAFVLKRKEFDPSGQIVFIESDHMISWKSAVYELERELDIVGQIKFVIFCNKSSETTPWRATAVPINLKSFVSRVPLREEWRGKRGEELQAISQIPDAVFVHNSGFTGGAKSLEGIKKMVRITLGLE